MINKMAIPVMQSSRNCANCVYWCGERKLEGFFRRVEINDPYAKGLCSNPKGYFNQMCYWQGTCGTFERHPVTKQ